MDFFLKFVLVFLPLLYWSFLLTFVIRLVFRMLKKDRPAAKKEVIAIFFMVSFLFMNIGFTFVIPSIIPAIPSLTNFFLSIVLALVIILITLRYAVINKKIFKTSIIIQAVYMGLVLVSFFYFSENLNGPVGIYVSE
ncbi:hypothetical protein GCM10008967_35850 [Bacillus carboniphilus]|uniref:Uncharacterized protein n=2 Tax=Bacillus carboniphilus TaxID=86663 RepID=A0ABN0WMX7_9BACI